jgi:hypothetical protein
MNRVLLFLTALGLSLFWAVAVQGAAPAPPSSICLQWGDLDDVSSFTTKVAGKQAVGGGTVKFYTVEGRHVIPGKVTVPLAGSGYMDGTIFHFSFAGAAKFETANGLQTYSLWAQGTWDVTAKTGTIQFHWSIPTDGEKDLVAVDCTTVVQAPSGPQGGAVPSAGAVTK